MSKGIITAIGLIVSIGVVALAFFLVALPIWVQSVAVDAQTQTVETTNALYQSQVDSLREQEENLDVINAEVAALRAQIPATGQLDDVFEVIGRAAQSSGATILSITAGENTAFSARNGVADDTLAEAPVPEATPNPEAAVQPDAGTTGVAPSPDIAQPGRQQVEFAITVTAPTMDQATAFLDALRAGPRLLTSVTTNAADNGEGGIALQVSALTFVDAEG